MHHLPSFVRTVCCFLSLVLYSSQAHAQFVWQELESPLSVEFKCGFFMDDVHGVVVGEDGTIIHTTNGGALWTGQQDKEQGWISTAGFKPGSGFVIAAGQAGLLLRSTDYGDIWQPVPTGLSAGTFLFGCQVNDENSFYLCGGGDTAAVVLKTTDGGQTWTYMHVPEMYFFERVIFLNEQLGFTCGSTLLGGGKIYRTTDGGDTWTAIYETDFGLITSIQCPSQTHIYATAYALDGITGMLIRSTNGGTTWDEQTVTDHPLRSNAFYDQEHGFACGSGIILYTSDGGVQWTDADYTGLEDLSYIQASAAGAFAVGTGGTLIRTQAGASVSAEPIVTVSRVYPNPAKRVVRFTLAEANVISVYDILGTMVHRAEVGGLSEYTLDRGSLPNGIYHYVISSKNAIGVKGSFVFE